LVHRGLAGKDILADIEADVENARTLVPALGTRTADGGMQLNGSCRKIFDELVATIEGLAGKLGL